MAYEQEAWHERRETRERYDKTLMDANKASAAVLPVISSPKYRSSLCDVRLK